MGSKRVLDKLLTLGAAAFLSVGGVAAAGQHYIVNGFQGTPIGDGNDPDGSGNTVTVNKGGFLETHTDPAISLGNNNQIDISGDVLRNSISGGGNYGTAANTIELASGNNVVVKNGGRLSVAPGGGVAYHVYGTNNSLVIEAGGTLRAIGTGSFAIGFSDSGATPAAQNTVDNYGTIYKGDQTAGQTGEIMQVAGTSTTNNGIKFTNHASGRIYGSLNFGDTNNNHLILYGGSLITGEIRTDTTVPARDNFLTLTGDNDGPVGEFTTNRLFGFNTLYKEGTGTWNLYTSLQDFDNRNNPDSTADIFVKSGTLHVDYSKVTDNYESNVRPIQVMSGGTLKVDNPHMVTTGAYVPFVNKVDVHAGGRLEGIGNVGSVVNAGTVAPGHDRLPHGILKINGNYRGENGSILEITSKLGGDESLTSKLWIAGDIEGTATTLIRENNAGGHGLDTIHGIKIVQVDGNSRPSAFALDSNISYKGVKIIEIDDYAYYLHENDQTGVSDGDFYLSTLTTDVVADGDPMLGHGIPGPVMNPGESWPNTHDDPNHPDHIIGGNRPTQPTGTRIYSSLISLYEALPQVMMSMNRLGSMQSRNGNRNWAAFDPCDPCDPESYATPVDRFGMWTSVEGGHEKSDPKWATTHYDFDLNYYRAKLGFEGPLAKLGSCGTLIGGVFGHYGRGESDVTGDFIGHGDINIDQWGVGAYATWLGSDGFYADLQGQANFYDIDVISGSGTATIAPGTVITKGRNGFGWAASLELGQRIGLGNGWSLTPQVQLQYSKFRFNSFAGTVGQTVHYDKGDSLYGRAGVAVAKETTFKSACGSERRLHAYGAVNAYYDFRGETGIYTNYATTSGQKNYYSSDNSRLQLGVDLGATYSWADDKYSVFAEVGARGATKRVKDNYSIHGKVGFGVQF